MSKDKQITTIKVTKGTVELINSLKIHQRQPAEEVILQLIEEKLKSQGKTLDKKGRADFHKIAYLSIILILFIGIGLLIIKPSLTGFSTVSKVAAYNDSLSLEFSESNSYTWQPTHTGNLKSLRLSGSFIEGTKAKVFLQKGDSRYLIFDSAEYNNARGISALTGLAVNEQDVSESSESIDSGNITAKLEYKSGSEFDIEDDGVEPLNGVVDITVENSLFNIQKNTSRLCTQWQVYSIDNDATSSFCYGSEKCCNFVGLLPSRTNWYDIVYARYVSHGFTKSSIASARVLSVDYRLDVDNPYSEIYYSSWKNLSIRFDTLDKIAFDSACEETCALSGFDDAEYTLAVEIENGSVSLDEVVYSVEEIMQNTAPILSKDFGAVNINKNDYVNIELSSYFSDSDGDSLIYSAYSPENIRIEISGSTAKIIPDKDFVGVRYAFFSANDSTDSVTGDIFMINISEQILSERIFSEKRIRINEPVKWVRNISQVSGNLSVDIPIHAFNVSAKKIVDGIAEDIPEEN